MILPQTKNTDIVVQDLQDEVLLYNLTTHKAFCLNETAAVVYQFCDGKTTFAELRSKTGKDFSDDVIKLAINELSQRDLLADKINFAADRRELLKKAALSAAALPLVTMISAPLAVHAQSGCSVDGTLTMSTTNPFNDYICDPDPSLNPPCCNGTFVNYDTCVGGTFGTCNCFCGSRTTGTPPA